MAVRLGRRLGDALVVLAAVAVCSQAIIAAAGAVTPGKNGLLLLAAPEGTAFAGADAVPMARVADCYEGPPNELWTVLPRGGRLVALGEGDSGQFSPDGRLLVTSYSPGCYSGNALSLSRSPFRREHLIPGADFIDDSSFAILGPWLGPESPTFVDPDGTYRDGITGRQLPLDVASVGPMSCSGRVASPDGMIATPARVPGGVSVTLHRISGRGWLGNENETSVQWSPDGRYVYFTTWSRQSDRLWRVDADGGDRRLLFSAPASADLGSQVSPDGRWIVMTTLDGRFGQRLSLITADGRRLHTVTPPPAGGDINAVAEWSPRGDLLLVVGGVTYYASPAPYAVTGPSFAYIVRPSGGHRHYLSLPGVGVWSPDERFIAYVTTDAAPGSPSEFSDSKLVISSVATGPSRTLLTASVPIDSNASAPGALVVADWQAAPGSAHPTRCADGAAPF